MITLIVRKEMRAIEAMIVGAIGTVQAQANSSMKLKLKIAWLSMLSAPTHLIAAIINGMIPAMRKGMRTYIMSVGGIAF
jgi:hypothetical protein